MVIGDLLSTITYLSCTTQIYLPRYLLSFLFLLDCSAWQWNSSLIFLSYSALYFYVSKKCYNVELGKLTNVLCPSCTAQLCQSYLWSRGPEWFFSSCVPPPPPPTNIGFSRRPPSAFSCFTNSSPFYMKKILVLCCKGCVLSLFILKVQHCRKFIIVKVLLRSFLTFVALIIDFIKLADCWQIGISTLFCYMPNLFTFEYEDYYS